MSRWLLALLSAGALSAADPGALEEGSESALAAGDATAAQARVEPETCTYSSYSWSVDQRRAVGRRQVSHPYAELGDGERSPEDPRCTVCEEDQVRVDLQALGIPLPEVQICYAYAEGFVAALRQIVASGEFEFVDLTAYRPGRTRGRVVDGLRTEWSNHSFGTAVDINASRNGLYNRCNVEELTVANLARCNLGIGGHWQPDRYPRQSITRNSIVYRAIGEQMGWKWGGEIAGNTRDLMHFSLSGY